MKRNIIHITLIAVAAFLAAATSSYWQNTTGEFLFAAVCIVLAGIPHGALDHLVAEKTRSNYRLLPYLLFYVAVLLAYLLVWWWLPGIAFLFFLLITAWHFGETDLTCFGNNHAASWRIAAYGIAVTMWLLMHDTGTLLYWTQLISKDSQLAVAAVTALATVPTFTWLGIAALLLLAHPKLTGKYALQVAVFIGFLYLLRHTSLITGFVLYFTGWHSMNALLHIRRRVFTQQPVRTMVLKALAPTLGAISLLTVIAWLGNGTWLQHNGLPALFILLSVLTLPHMTEMHRLYTHTKTG